MKTFNKYILILFCLLLFVACVETETLESIELNHQLEKEGVLFHHYFTDNLSGGIDGLVEEYNNQQDIYQVKVVPIDHEAYKVNILKDFEEGVPADMNSYWAGAKTQDIVRYLEPLDELFAEGQLDQLFSKSVLESACSYDGHYYLVPITQHYISFFYNTEVFNRLGLKEPENWEAFIEICEVLKNNDVTPIGLGAKDKWPAQFWFDYILLRTAGKDYRDGLLNGINQYTDDEVVETIMIWKELLDAGYFNESPDDHDWDVETVELLMDGTYGMTLMGTWLFNILDDAGYQDQYGVFSFPVMNEAIPVVALGPIDGIIIGKDGLNIEGAKDALVHFASLENQVIMADGAGSFIPNTLAKDEYYSDLQMKLLKDIRASEEWAMNYDLATNPNKAKFGLDFFVEFLVFPEEYQYLLEELQINME